MDVERILISKFEQGFRRVIGGSIGNCFVCDRLVAGFDFDLIVCVACTGTGGSLGRCWNWRQGRERKPSKLAGHRLAHCMHSGRSFFEIRENQDGVGHVS